jgi:hypothetical protein
MQQQMFAGTRVQLLTLGTKYHQEALLSIVAYNTKGGGLTPLGVEIGGSMSRAGQGVYHRCPRHIFRGSVRPQNLGSIFLSAIERPCLAHRPKFQGMLESAFIV